MRSPAQVREFTVRQWIESAAADLEWAEMGAKSSEIRGIAQIGFHAQQAVEKLLKAFLAAHDVVPEDHHNIAA
jgi:HEPN domain-containing protein